jgi:protein TonB
MFEQTFIPKAQGRSSKWGVALLIQAVLLGVIVVVPLVYLDVLPANQMVSILIAPPPPSPPPPPAPAPAFKVPPHHAAPEIRKFDLTALVTPTSVAKQVPVIEDVPEPAATSTTASAGVIGGVAGGVAGGQAGGVLGSIMNSPTPAPPPPPAKPVTAIAPPAPGVIHIGGNVEAAKLISAPEPAYPQVAKQARVQGTVELKAVIGKDGKVQQLQVASGTPLLVEAAVEAVKRWVYSPTILNGVPVDVATEIEVTFRLS